MEVNGYFFPDIDWYDVVSSILDMWIPAIIDFIRSGDSQCALYFMDGPYRMHLDWISTSELNISLLSSDKEEATNICCMHDFLESIIRGVDLFCKFCRDNNSGFISSKTFLRIDANGKKLKSVAANLK